MPPRGESGRPGHAGTALSGAAQRARERPGMDDKTGWWIVFEALRRAGWASSSARVCGSTVQEEIGLRGSKTSAYRINPYIGIAVDVCHASDSPSIEKKHEGDIALDKGPVNLSGPNMNPRLVSGDRGGQGARDPVPVAGRAGLLDRRQRHPDHSGGGGGGSDRSAPTLHAPPVETGVLRDLDAPPICWRPSLWHSRP